MRVLVIGGTSFMGPYIIRRLDEAGHAVTVFHRGQTEAELPSAVRIIKGDRENLADFAGQFKQLAPEVVLDMVLFTEAQAQNLMNTFKGLTGRVVAASSCDVYRAYGQILGKESGPLDPTPYTEDGPLRMSRYPYRDESFKVPENMASWMENYDKILVEEVVMNDPDLPGTILRLPAVYGPNDPLHRLFPYLKRMDDGQKAILLQEDQAGWSWTRGYVENVAAAIALAVTDERAARRIYNVGESKSYSEAEWVRQIGEVVGWRGEVIVLPKERLPEHLQSKGNWGQDLTVDSRRIRQELGYAEPVALDEALRRTVEWERAHPPQFDPAQFDYAAEDAAMAGNL
jgi:nucleoside-diphosphate-sugar epimerase